MSKHYIAPLSDNIERTSVFYKNRYGFTLAGDLYHLKNLDKNKQYPALIVGAPYGGVKEQGPCIYANELAKRGFIVLTFDPCFMGESEGYPRHVSSPDIFTENFSSGVDYLGLLPFVNREQIGAIGICGSGGFALSATQMDTRIKAVVPEDLTEPTAEWFRFYALKRGHHIHALGGFTTTSNLVFMNYHLLDYLDEISPRPILFIVGDRAHSKFFSEEAFNKASEPKELYVVDDAEHIDLYDKTDKIPFDKLELFFKNNLK